MSFGEVGFESSIQQLRLFVSALSNGCLFF